MTCMDTARDLSVLMTVLVMALLAWRLLGPRHAVDPPDEATRRRRFKIGWEVRALVIGSAGPCLAAMCAGYVPAEYALPLALFVAAGFLIAEFIAPTGIGDRR